MGAIIRNIGSALSDSDIEQILADYFEHEIPYTIAMCTDESLQEYRADLVRSLQNTLEVDINAAQSFEAQMEEVCQVFETALTKLFSLPNEQIKQWMLGPTLSKHPYFIDYARATWQERQPAVSGRFDMMVNAEGQLQVIEFNGDTPSMYADSLYFTHAVGELLERDTFNSHWEESQAVVNEGFRQARTVAALGENLDIVSEDTATIEYMASLLSKEGERKTFILNKDQLDFELLDNSFNITDEHGTRYNLDLIYALIPWEELLESGHSSIFTGWEYWYQKVRFVEPAWRWFMSNKGFLAFVTDLIEHNELSVSDNFALVPTYLDPSRLAGKRYIAKDALGRGGDGIQVIDANQQLLYDETEYYGGAPVYQAYLEHYPLDQYSNLIACMWVSSYKEHNKFHMSPSTLAFRIMPKSELVTRTGYELFAPHVLSEA